MICYNCGAEVGRYEYCPECNVDLTVFQKVHRISNSYYNDGLTKAKVKNMSGAIVSLQKSLKFNKYNIDARNLLGLVYYEIGETAKALCEWVISINYQEDDNPADRYLKEIYRNRSQLEAISQTIKKYNQAILYCKQGSRDLAIIQLKKVLSLNPKLVKGHQLLALLYLQEEQFEKAKKSLRNAGKIDADNTLTLKYLKEVNRALRESEKNKKATDEDLISYQSGNETIIMPKRFRESSLAGTIGYMLLGLVIGAAAVMFLIVPGERNKAANEAKEKLLEASDTISTNGQTITDLENQIESLQAELDAAKERENSSQAVVDSYESLVKAFKSSRTGNALDTGDILDSIDVSYLSEEAKANYDYIRESIKEDYVRLMFNRGCDYINDNKWPEAVDSLEKVMELDKSYNDGIAAYYLAQAYRKVDNDEAAREYYKYVVDKFPDSNIAITARNYIGDSQ